MNKNIFNAKNNENYSDQMARLLNRNHQYGGIVRSITFQVTDACNLACSYCYQINKGHRVMKLDYAKKLIDLILDNDEKLNGYLDLDKSPAIILDFIGGEPLLEIDLIDQICDYFLESATKRHHRWAVYHCFAFSSNGILYFDEKVQKFLKKHPNDVSLSITIDGNKKLHDSCRKFPDGRPSYDIVEAAVKDWNSKVINPPSKITIAPGNINHLHEAFSHMVKLGYTDINANTVFEKGWTIEHAKIYYEELKKIADYLLENEIDNIYCSLFEPHFFKPLDPEDVQNWCGGAGDMLAMDPDGYLYPCIRYMESSIGTKVPPYRIGHVNTGIATTQEEQKKIKCLNCITRKSQSTKKCFNCPIAAGCAWCTAYNYQENGTPNSRCTYICEMHKARALANNYYWNQCYRNHNSSQRMPIYCPKEWALEIISEDEYEKLCNLSKE